MIKSYKFRMALTFALTFCAAAPAYAAEQAVLRNGFTINFESRQASGESTRLFLTSAKDSFVDVSTAEIVSFEPAPPMAAPVEAPPVPEKAIVVIPKPAPAPDLHAIVTGAAAKHELDPELINSVIRAESSFHQRAVSPKGARGLMQLMPGTAQQLGIADSFDASANVNGGTRYLRDLLVQNNYDLAKALAAYNAGQHRVQQYHGVPPYRETRLYVAKIIRDFNRKKLAQQASLKSVKTDTSAKAASGPHAAMSGAAH